MPGSLPLSNEAQLEEKCRAGFEAMAKVRSWPIARLASEPYQYRNADTVRRYEAWKEGWLACSAQAPSIAQAAALDNQARNGVLETAAQLCDSRHGGVEFARLIRSQKTEADVLATTLGKVNVKTALRLAAVREALRAARFQALAELHRAETRAITKQS